MPATQAASLRGFLTTAAAFVIVVAGMKAASSILVPLLLAVFIAVITTPLFVGLQRRGLPAWLALLILILGLVLLATAGAAVVTQSLNQFARNLPEYQQGLQIQVTSVVQWMQARGIEAPTAAIEDALKSKSAIQYVAATVSAVTALFGQTFIIMLIVIFLLFEAAILPAKIKFAAGPRTDTLERIGQVVENVRRYVGLKTLMSLLTGVLVFLVALIARVDYPILLGLLAFFLNYVPNIGSIMAAVPGILLAFIQYGFARAVLVTIGYLVANISVSNFIEPRFMGKGLGLSPMIIVVSMIVWAWVLGPVGMLLSVPLTMTVKIALESIDETRGLAVLLGSAVPKDNLPAN